MTPQTPKRLCNRMLISMTGFMKPRRTYRRHRGVLSVMMVTLILTLAVVLGSGSLATADTIDLPAGVACEFPLSIEVSGGNLVMREFEDKNGNTVRLLTAGKGFTLVFTNVDTGATFSLESNGSVTRTTINPDGSQTVTLTGHNVLILFPTDVPAGPSTTLHEGRVVYVDTSGVFTVQEVSGETTDICAALSN
jgi:hypothetical protein